ncbi:hypothetical protein SSAG_04577 [Streptomyces sp. Mg1]|nr:hypothetical protein SSAG_04577 [Streptomyces sp. Mg1]
MVGALLCPHPKVLSACTYVAGNTLSPREGGRYPLHRIPQRAETP